MIVRVSPGYERYLAAELAIIVANIGRDVKYRADSADDPDWYRVNYATLSPVPAELFDPTAVTDTCILTVPVEHEATIKEVTQRATA